uniref:Golgin subfamily A member 7 n=1 Tax=Papio anubis TaxID=9555 RepID=A0A8I5N4P4_PAPAN
MRPQQAPVSGKVFIQRDYSSGTRCQFQTKFPAELENRIDRQQFEETVRTLNNLYAEAEKLGGQSYLEGCLACLTAYTIFLCMETHYEKVTLLLFSQKSLKIMKKASLLHIDAYTVIVAVKYLGAFIIQIVFRCTEAHSPESFKTGYSWYVHLQLTCQCSDWPTLKKNVENLYVLFLLSFLGMFLLYFPKCHSLLPPEFLPSLSSWLLAPELLISQLKMTRSQTSHLPILSVAPLSFQYHLWA